MLKKMFIGMMIGLSLCSMSSVSAAPPKVTKKLGNPISKYNIKPGDVIAVEVNILGTTKIVLVYVHKDMSADYMYNGKLYPFPLVDLDSFVWAFYIKQ